LHNWFLRPGLCQGTHVLQASGAEALDARKLVLEIMGEPVDNPGTPTLCSLLGEDIPANRPIKENQLAIDRERSTYLGCRFSLIARTPTLIGKETPLSPMPRISLNLKNYPLICRKIGVRIVTNFLA
jgi:hypothetical protein